MSISSTSKQSSLENCDDICLVCNDQSSGYHYGIPSCNGCKTFFRRAIVQNLTFICQLGGKCSVDKTVRCACRFCRLKKCIDMGMDKNAIQNNREPIGYTKRSRKKKLSFAQDDQQPSTSKETLSPLDSPETFPELDRLVTIEKRLQKLRIGILNVPTELETALLSERLLENEGFIEKNGREFKSPFFQRYFTEEDASFWIDRDATLMLEWIKCLLGGQELDVEDLDTKEDRIVFPNGAWFDTGQKQETSLFVSERSQLINGILKDIRKLEFDEVEMVAFRALLALNSNIEELTSKGREIIEKNRSSIALSIHQYLEQKMGGFLEADERFGSLLLVGPRLANVEPEFRDAAFAIDFFDKTNHKLIGQLQVEIWRQRGESSNSDSLKGVREISEGGLISSLSLRSNSPHSLVNYYFAQIHVNQRNQAIQETIQRATF